MSANTLFYGDNLDVLRRHIPAESVDLIYLDPPFNSNRDYNVLFREQSGEQSSSQIKAFTDTWKWNEIAYHEFLETCQNHRLIEMMQGFLSYLGRNDLTAYLVMMAPRLVELHRALKSTGSLYLHCDPAASHYLKVMLDVIFGPRNFRNEIVWKRTSAHSDGAQGRQQLGQIHDIVFFYSKSQQAVWNLQYTAYDEKYINDFYRHIEPETGRRFRLDNLTGPGGASKGNPFYEVMGVSRYWRYSRERMQKLIEEGRIIQSRPGIVPSYKRYLDEMPGVPLQDVWTDVSPISSQAKERLGYPTQKPLSLLERIIQASSNEGDVVLDPFCGCGTATIAAQKLGRKWIGIDITHLAVALIKYRLSDAFGLKDKKDYAVIGEPVTEAEARALALQDRDEFQRWAIGLVDRARPYQEKKGADGGIDGVLYFRDDRKEPKKGVLQVKSGHVQVSLVRDFAHVVNREKATLGLFVSLDSPTKPMVEEAGKFGFYQSPISRKPIPKLQIKTVGQLLAGDGFMVPAQAQMIGIAQAEAIRNNSGQSSLF